MTISTLLGQESTGGLKIGVNMATESGDAKGVYYKPGLHIGFYYECMLSKKLAVQPEIMYSMQGTNFKGKLGGQKIAGSDNFNYINFPLLAKYYITDKISIHSGAQLAYLVSAETKIADQTNDVREYINEIDLSICSGVGYKTSIAYLDLRYNYGISNMLKSQYSHDLHITNEVIQLSVGCNF